MERKLSKRLMRHRKYKHYAAVLAGAAIMAGTSLHGIPFAKASAAENPSVNSPATTGQLTPVDPDTKKVIDEANAAITDPSTKKDSDQNKNDQKADRDRGEKRHHRDGYDHSRYEHERWNDRGQAFEQRIAWYNDSLNKIQFYNNTTSPLDIVLAIADNLGFDVNNDIFTLIRQNGDQSIVRVAHNGNSYNVTIDQLANNNWIISSIRLVQ